MRARAGMRTWVAASAALALACRAAALHLTEDNEPEGGFLQQVVVDLGGWGENQDLFSMGMSLLTGGGGPCFDHALDAGLACQEEVDRSIQKYMNLTRAVKDIQEPLLSHGFDLEEYLLLLVQVVGEMNGTRTRPDEGDGVDAITTMTQEYMVDPESAMIVVRELRGYYEKHKLLGYGTSLDDLLVRAANLTIFDLVFWDLELGASCCDQLKSFLSKGCVCDQGTTGELLNEVWLRLEPQWKREVLKEGNAQCDLELDPAIIMTNGKLSDLDTTPECACRKALALADPKYSSTGGDAQNMIGVSKQRLEFKSIRDAEMFLLEERIRNLDVDSAEKANLRDICL